ncbi:hypothetical protein D9615_003408 [Tricholomella constricta]|uniref:MICOS complex subunit MIC12 n=1 Tax=Tricholomella constricta TaxID=117010 RepID=A0A8H5M866_9AGAR|nr:hypothetical protein D9615_003408 [Tricholomella constricta]
MSILIGPVSGALVAGGASHLHNFLQHLTATKRKLGCTQVYYGFSNLMHTRTEQHRADLHALSVRLVSTPTTPAPPPAAARITHHPFSSMLKDRWNHELGALFAGFGSWDRRAVAWGRRVLYGYGDTNGLGLEEGEDTTNRDPAELEQLQKDPSST